MFYVNRGNIITYPIMSVSHFSFLNVILKNTFGKVPFQFISKNTTSEVAHISQAISDNDKLISLINQRMLKMSLSAIRS